MLITSALIVTLAMQRLSFYTPQTQTYVIRGRVVDSKGIPVKKALIFDDFEGGSPSDMFVGVQSDESGKFSLPVTGDVRLGPILLFITSEMPTEAVTFMYPPFSGSPPHIRGEFASVRIAPGQQKELDVGD